MLHDVIFVLYFALPGAIANMAPVFAAKGNWAPFLDKPVDFGLTVRGRRILGDHKTFRGFVFGYVFAQVFIFLQAWLYHSVEGVREFSNIDYQELSLVVLALLMTLGALGGDAIKSFFKRQIGIKPGHTWVPFDQIDSVLGLMVVCGLYLDLSPTTWVLGFVVGSLLHPAATTIGWVLKLKDEPF